MERREKETLIMNFWDNLIPEVRDEILVINVMEDIPLLYEKLDIVQIHEDSIKPSFVDTPMFIDLIKEYYTKDNFPWPLFYKVLNMQLSIKAITCTMSAMMISLIIEQKLKQIAKPENYIIIRIYPNKSYKSRIVYFMHYSDKPDMLYHYIHPLFNIKSPRSEKYKLHIIERMKLLNYPIEDAYKYKVRVKPNIEGYFKKIHYEDIQSETNVISNIYKISEFEMPWYNYASREYIQKILMNYKPFLTIP